MPILFALHFKPVGLTWRNIDEILIFFGGALSFTPKIPFHATGLHSRWDVETHAPWRHGHADAIIIFNAHRFFSGGATAFGLNSATPLIPHSATDRKR